MPHMIVEYSNNLKELQAEKLLLGLNQALIETGHIKAAELKARLSNTADFLIGLGDLDHAFIHVHVYLLAGRSDAEKKAIADAAITALQAFSAYQADQLTVQLSVQLTDMPAADYRKSVVTH